MSDNSVIASYIKKYEREQDFFYKAAEQCHMRIRDALSQSGIQHVGMFRTKQKERLEAKLYQRAADGHVYDSADDIESDMVDLAGVRFVLYFPGDIPEALRIIRSLYHPHPDDERPFPRGQRPSAKDHKYRFPGYYATHLLVVLDVSTLDDNAKHCAGTRVEIQVASMFMHAWAEVEHDLVYKPSTGTALSENEYSWLDQINGLAMAGDLALEQLQRSINARIAEAGRRFQNHYELASFLHARAVKGTRDGEPRMGRADKLLAFLARLELDQPARVELYLDRIRADAGESLVDQVVARVIESAAGGAEERRTLWREIDAATNVPSPYGGEAIVDDGQAASFAIQSRLLKHWATLDDAARAILAQKSSHRISGVIDWVDVKMVMELLGIDERIANRLIAAHQAMTRLRYGNWHGSNEAIEEHAEAVREVIRRVYSQFADVLSERGEA